MVNLVSRIFHRRHRRTWLGVLALSLFGAGPVASGCAPGFDPPSKIQGLRVFAAPADLPYAQPGDDVTFELSYEDAPSDTSEGGRAIQILWIGGCYNPEGDQYYACYPQFAKLLGGMTEGGAPPKGLLGVGPTFTLTIPDDIISRRPPPPAGGGGRYGMAYVFFAACAGELRQVPAEGDGKAGSFPIGCFNEAGQRLGAESFVPGYTQVYVFEDGRTNANPVISSLTLGRDGEPGAVAIPEDPDDPKDLPVVERCDVSEETRRTAACNKGEESTKGCTTYALKAILPRDVAELDPGATGADGKPMRESVWLDYYADQGDLGKSVKLVTDSTGRYVEDHETTWTPPQDPGITTIYVAAHDSRGGASVVRRQVRVE
jgi:hypothetical protein